jgi:Tfp pilus assembly protein PilF
MALKKPGFVLALVLAFGGMLRAQDWRGGNGRIEGVVENAKGEPIADATVSLRWKDGKGPDVKTNKKGKWAILGISGGPWNIDISAPGYETRKTSVDVSEIQRALPVKVQLEPEVKKEPAHEEITVGGKKISKETADALEKGNSAWDAAIKAQEAHGNCRVSPAPGQESAEAIARCEKEAESAKRQKFQESSEEYGKALAELSDNEPLLMKLEMAGYLTQNFGQAEKYARLIVAKNPANDTSWLMIAEIELQKGNLAEGKAAIEKVPAEKLTDPTVFLNMGIICYNKNKPAEAEGYFSKAIEVKGDMAEAYYYRGLSRYQAKNKAGARADLDKYVALDPQGKDADTAKEVLKTLK